MECPYCGKEIILNLSLDKPPEKVELKKKPKPKINKNKICEFKFSEDASCANKALPGSKYCKEHSKG